MPETDGLALLGVKVRDTITGFTGTVVCCTQWMNGCIRLQIQPNELDKDGKPQDGQVFDIQQLERVEPPKPEPVVPSEKRGGDRDDRLAMSRQ